MFIYQKLMKGSFFDSPPFNFVSTHHRTEMQEDLQKLPPGFPRGVVPQPPFPPLVPTMGQMHTLMPTQSLQPTQQLEYKVQ